jgi:prolyl-tRNA synthetase
VLQMGCYGIGISRILAASLEVLSSETELSWPTEIVPYQIMIIAPKGGSKEFAAFEQVMSLYDQLNSRDDFKNDIIVDDRLNLTVGKKLKEAKQTGYSHIVLFGKECILEENPVIELHSGKDMIRMSVNQVMYHFETIQNSV